VQGWTLVLYSARAKFAYFRITVTIDEQISALDDNVRRLKIEYDVYFGGGAKRPPNDTEWRVHSTIKKLGDGQKLTFAQRFKFNSIVQRYAVFSDLWRQKLKIKEEGYRRPQDAILGIQGMRSMDDGSGEEAEVREGKPFTVCCANPDSEREKVEQLYRVMTEAKRRGGEKVGDAANLDNFKAFVRRKTEQIRNECGCHEVEYTVEVQGGQVRLKAKAKA